MGSDIHFALRENEVKFSYLLRITYLIHIRVNVWVWKLYSRKENTQLSPGWLLSSGTHTFRAADGEMHLEKQFWATRPGWNQRHQYPGQQNTATYFTVYFLYCGQCYYVRVFNSTLLNPEDRTRRQWGPETELYLWTFPGLSFCILVLSGLCNALLHSCAS